MSHIADSFAAFSDDMRADLRRRVLLARTALGRAVLLAENETPHGVSTAGFDKEDTGDGQWITISGAGGTTHICIGSDGFIKHGPEALKDRYADEALSKSLKDPELKDKKSKDFSHPSESQAVKDFVSGKSEHKLFSKSLGGSGRDTMLESIMKESGRANTPKAVNEEQMNDLQKKGWMISYRGVSNGKHAEDFKSGQHFAGAGLFGNGTYVQKEGGILGIGGKNKSAAISHASQYGEHVMRIALSPDAKVVNLSKVQAEQKQYQKELGEKRIAGKMTQKEYQAHMDIAADEGRFAALKNYDAVYCTHGGYYNIVNRSKCAVQDTNVALPRR